MAEMRLQLVEELVPLGDRGVVLVAEIADLVAETLSSRFLKASRAIRAEGSEANACSTDRLTDFVATVSAKDQQLGDWLQRALAAFFAGEAVPKLDRRRKAEPVAQAVEPAAQG